MKEKKSEILPMLPLRDVVVYPQLVIPLFVGREKSIQAIEKANNGDKKILLVAQKNANKDEPLVKDLFKIEFTIHYSRQRIALNDLYFYQNT